MVFAAIRGRLAPLNTPNLRRYWLNAVISAFGDSVTSIALMLMVLQRTGSISLMATMSIVVSVPGIVFGLVNATWVDRWNAQRVIVRSQLLRALLILGLVYVDLGNQLWMAFVLAACQSLVGTFDDPARGRMVAMLTTTETRLSVNSLTSSGVMVAGMLGTTVGGLLVGTGGRYWPAFAIDSVTFVAGAAALTGIAGNFDPSTQSPHSGKVWGRLADDVLEGITAIRRSPVLVAVLWAASASTIGLSAATIMLTPLIVDVLYLQPAWFGAIEATQASSAIAIALAIGVFGRSLDPKRLVALGMMATGLVIGLIGSAVDVWTLLISMFLVGISITPVSSGYSTLLQTYAPRAMIGRIAATMNTLVQTFSIAAMAGAGLLGDAVGVRSVFWIAGGVCAFAGVWSGALFRKEDAAGPDGV